MDNPNCCGIGYHTCTRNTPLYLHCLWAGNKEPPDSEHKQQTESSRIREMEKAPCDGWTMERCVFLLQGNKRSAPPLGSLWYRNYHNTHLQILGSYTFIKLKHGKRPISRLSMRLTSTAHRYSSSTPSDHHLHQIWTQEKAITFELSCVILSTQLQ